MANSPRSSPLLPAQVRLFRSSCSLSPLSRSLTVGSALRSNPFAPYVPCHRVIASTLFVGGFCGEWTASGEGKKTSEKFELLRREGVEFDGKGYLKDRLKLWDGK